MNKTDLSSVTEEQLLLRQLREGDMGSYETLFHRYYPTFFAFARGMLKDAGAAEDIIQNVFMKIWIHREALDETMSIKNYIYVLSKREVFNYLRAKYNTHVVLTEDMMTLPPKRRSVFCLSRFKSLTNQEIADKLGISIRTVEKHIELALRTFKEQLGSFFALFVGLFL